MQVFTSSSRETQRTADYVLEGLYSTSDSWDEWNATFARSGRVANAEVFTGKRIVDKVRPIVETILWENTAHYCAER